MKEDPGEDVEDGGNHVLIHQVHYCLQDKTNDHHILIYEVHDGLQDKTSITSCALYNFWFCNIFAFFYEDLAWWMKLHSIT